MHYTVKLKRSQETATGVTDVSGLTQVFYSAVADDVVFLYIGFCLRADKFPEAQGSTEDIYDEAPLFQDTVDQFISKIKISTAKTQRLWKPWEPSQSEIDSIKNKEKAIPYIYNDGAGNDKATGKKLRWDDQNGNPIGTTNSKGFTWNGNSTIGYGHLLHKGQVDPNSALDAPYITRNSMGDDLSQSEMDKIFERDLIDRGGAGIGAGSINSIVFVPLYQREYDALINQIFNGTNKKTVRQLDTGRYTKSGELLLSNKAAPPDRRKIQYDTFFKGKYS